MYPIKLFNADSGAGPGNSTAPPPPPSKDNGPKYPLQNEIKELGYGAKFGERSIQVVKNKYENLPDATTNETTRTLVQPAYVIDSKDEVVDTKKDYLDNLDDLLFKTLAEAHVIVLDKAAEARYLKVLGAATNTTPLKK